MNALNWVLTGFLILGAASGWAFMVIYSRRWHWWRDEHGAHLGAFTLSLTLIMTVYVFRPFIDPVVFALVRAPLFVLITLGMVWRLVLLLRSDGLRRGVH